MKVLALGCLTLAAAMLFAGGSVMGADAKSGEFRPVSRTDTLPRKVVVGTTMGRIRGSFDERVKTSLEFLDEMAKDAAKQGKKLDLMILPEYSIMSGVGAFGKEQAVPVEGKVTEIFGAAAAKYHSYLIVPMIMKEADGKKASNAAVLFGRDGKVAGIYRKHHVVADLAVKDPAESLEGGLTPGNETPVFDCDFGKLGIQICWDNAYEDGWEKLARQGAEIVAWPSASPANIRAQWWAQKYSMYVVSATPRDNATIFNPTGMISAQIEGKSASSPHVLVNEIDLSYAVLGWTEPLQDGKALKKKYGDKVDFQYSPREDQGLFWSNDPNKSIGDMVRELGLLQLHDHVVKSEEIEDSVRGGK
jgi:predicted amidohydrolase